MTAPGHPIPGIAMRRVKTDWPMASQVLPSGRPGGKGGYWPRRHPSNAVAKALSPP